MNYKAFVIMPFSKEFNDTYNLGIKAAALECKVDAKRLDDDFFVTNMVEEIYRKINDADFVIADMTGRNPNVFYEVGYADAKNKLTLLLTKDISDIPFDFKQKLHIEYNDVTSLKENLIDKIEWAKHEIDKTRQKSVESNFYIKYAWLNRTDNSDIAQIHCLLEISNLSDKPIDKLQMIEIITSPDWDFFINDKLIKNESFVANNVNLKRHRFTPEEKIIPIHDHIQIELEGNRTLWKSWSNTEQQNNYVLAGWVDIKVFVDNRETIRRITLNKTLVEIPF